MRLHNRAEKDFNHPLVGGLALRYERLAVAAGLGLQIFVYVPEPGSRSEQAFVFLARDTADHSVQHVGLLPDQGAVDQLRGRYVSS